MNIEEIIITVYCLVAEIVEEAGRLRERGFPPGLTDAEVLTMEIVGEMEGRDGDAAIWKYFGEHWRAWFPAIGSYPNFSKHCANLRFMKEKVMAMLFAPDSRLHIIDGVPMKLCHLSRAYRCKSLSEYNDFGYCAAKDEHYFGLRGHPVINERGYIVHCSYTSPKMDEREALENLRGTIKGMLLGDKGFIGEERRISLLSDGINLQTLKRKNMTESRSKDFLRWLAKTRKTIETAISLLTEMFNFNQPKARSIHHFINKTSRKILAYNFYIMLRC
jgi:Transposase DDE domain